jgi:hypothetical protein
MPSPVTLIDEGLRAVSEPVTDVYAWGVVVVAVVVVLVAGAVVVVVVVSLTIATSTPF